MKRSTLLLICCIAALSLALWQSQARAGRLRRDRDRLSANQSALLGDMETYRLRDSLHAASVGALTLHAAELETHCGRLAALVKDMGIKLRRVESLSQAATETRYTVQAPVRDTILLSAPAQLIRYRDRHLALEGTIRDSLFEGSVRSWDTLTQVVHRIPRRFLFIRYGTRALRQEIVSSNPHTRITYARYIRVEK